MDLDPGYFTIPIESGYIASTPDQATMWELWDELYSDPMPDPYSDPLAVWRFALILAIVAALVYLIFKINA